MFHKIKNKFFKFIDLAACSIIIILAISFSSCSHDNPVTTSYSLDPPRYNWHIDTLNADIQDMYAQDSNNVFFADIWHRLIYYNGISYQYIDCGNLSVESIGGYDKYNVYLGTYDQALYMPKVLKWNGTGLNEILISDTISRYAEIKSVYVCSPNEIWFGTSNGRVYKYDGSTFNAFYFDTMMYIKPFLRDENNSLYFAGSIDYYLPQIDSSKQFIYKYVNSSWVKVYEKQWYNTTDTAFTTRNFGNTIVGFNNYGIYKFTGNSFHIIFHETRLLPSGYIAGNSFSNLIDYGNTNEEFFLYNWNSNSWSKEIKIDYEEEMFNLCSVQNFYYCTTFKPWRTLIFIGKPKKGG